MAHHPNPHLSAYDNMPEVQDGTSLLESFRTSDPVPGQDSPPDFTTFEAIHLRQFTLHKITNFCQTLIASFQRLPTAGELPRVL